MLQAEEEGEIWAGAEGVREIQAEGEEGQQLI